MRKQTICCLIVFLVLHFLAGFYLFADQTKALPMGSLLGKVIDIDTQMGLPGVYITLSDSTGSAVSDERGEFIINAVPAGSHTIRFEFTGSRPLIKSEVMIKPDRTTLLTVKFQIQPQAQEQVTVQAGYFNDQTEEPAPSTTFTQEEVRRSPSSAGDVARIVANLPSVTQLNDQKNNLIVRGSSPNENLFIIDNIEVPNISHFPFQGTGGGAISLVNVDFLDSVSFSPGGFSALFGDRMSSVTQLTFRQGSRDHFNAQLSMDMVGIGAVAEGPLFSKNGSWMLSYRHSYVDLVTQMMKTGVIPSWSDLQGKIAWDFGDNHHLTLIALAGWDESDFKEEEALKTGQDYFGLTRDNSQTLGLNWFALWAPGAYSDTSLSFSQVNYHQNWQWTYSGESAIKNDSCDQSLTLRHQTTFTFPRGHRLRVGGSWQEIRSHYDYFCGATLDNLGQANGAIFVDIPWQGRKTALFADWTLPLFSRISLSLGMRGDSFSGRDHFLWSPRLNLGFSLSNTLSLDLYGGIFRQTLPQLLLTQNSDNRFLSDPLCKQLGANLSWQMNDSTQLILAVYGKGYEHLPIDPSQAELCLLDEQLNQYRFGDQHLSDLGQGRAYGVELSVQKKLKKRFYGICSAALSRSEYRDASGNWRRRISDRQYIFNLVGGYKAGKTWDFSAKWLLAGGVPYTPFDQQASHTANAGVYDLNQINGARLKPYHTLNLSIDKHFFFSGSSLTLNLSFWNAYNQDNIAFLFWNRVENRQGEEKQWSLLPILGVEYEF